MRLISAAAALLTFALPGCAPVAPASNSAVAQADGLWGQRNLLAWSVGPYDAERRGPEARAEMLQDLGFERYSYYWVPSYIPSFEEEILAMKAKGIAIQGWWAPFEPDDPLLGEILALFEKHAIRPHLWTIPPLPDFAMLVDESDGALPANFTQLPPGERVQYYPVVSRLMLEQEQRGWPQTPEGYQARVEREAARLKAIADKAAPFGVTVDLYGHIQWLGVPEHQADVVELLRSQGVENVGIVYNFSHSRSIYRDDAADFARTWARIQPYVSSINVAGTHMEDGSALLPGQGDSELAMMRVIEASGWRGPVGVNAETGGDAAETLTAAVTALSDLAQAID